MKNIYIILLLILVVGCQQKSAVGQLDEIDSLITHDQYDDAFVKIDKVDKTSLNQEEYAHYNLLVAQRCCIKRQRDTTGLLDKIVIPYYLSTNKQVNMYGGLAIFAMDFHICKKIRSIHLFLKVSFSMKAFCW